MPSLRFRKGYQKKMGDYDATLLGAVAQLSPVEKEELRRLYCASDEPETAADRSARFEDRLRFLLNLGFVSEENGIITYLGSL